MSVSRLVVTLLAALAATACGVMDSPVEPASRDIAPQSAFSLAAPNVVASVTGSGFVDYDPTAAKYLRRFTISAVGRADGSAQGQWNLVLGPHDVAVHGTVTCASFNGNSAYVGGTWDRSTYGEEWDDQVVGVAIELIDNGTNDADNPDMISSVFYYLESSPGSPEDYCANPTPGPVMPITQGNVTVH